MKPSVAGWLFAGPALAIIAVFFFLPVLAALAFKDHMQYIGLVCQIDDVNGKSVLGFVRGQSAGR